ncbi:prevent-host-death protein [Vineibacter terrae]|uniref:Prevent-host-death protein n=1 Tax=Vineibacter terrae TaxID=2586908 RepID=A0A5C8PQL4_9HYPH|nr:prevent-host-death protein [Vineibacter terrae]TXL76709.1 prevent-host-death protein [Vineibacter terrae]
MPDTYTYRAEGELARLVERARAGDEVIVTTDDNHQAKLVPVETAPQSRAAREPRKFGLLRGQIRPAPDWDSDEVNEEIARRFNDDEI